MPCTAAVIEHAFRSRSLASINVGNDANVADVLNPRLVVSMFGCIAPDAFSN